MDKSSKIKTFIVKTIIKEAIFIIEGSHSKFLKNQIMINEMNNNINDINLGIENLIQNKEKGISFNKLNYPLFFFNQGSDNQTYSIISNLKESDKEYQYFLKLKNIHAISKRDQIKLSNYLYYDQIDFLKELKDILNLRNPVRKDERRDDLLSLEEIAGNFILTADNYIKLIYLFLRIYANIPIVIFGEKWCGKFSLVKKLAEFINNGEHNTLTLEIHSDTSEKNIIEFIEKEVIEESVFLNNKENEEKKKKMYEEKGLFYDNKKLFVILRGINTCKSMGIISEIICKHSYQGKPLPSNIVFIGICESYIQEEDRFIEIAKKMELKEEKLEKIRKVKYEDLYPLPFSLLNFVINFGNLTIRDKKYILKNDNIWN